MLRIETVRAWGTTGLFLARGIALICVISCAARIAAVVDPAENQRLIAYFKDRHICLLEANKLLLRFTPYPLQSAGASEGWTGPHAP